MEVWEGLDSIMGRVIDAVYVENVVGGWMMSEKLRKKHQQWSRIYIG